jgi:hypothetical protein
MTGSRNDNPRALYLAFITDCELRVSQQKQLIAGLKKQGLSTLHAEVDLKRQEASLRQLENHAALMNDLLQPDRYRS